MKYIFLAHKTGIAKGSGNAYNMLELSLQHRNFTVDCTIPKDGLEKIKEGDEVFVKWVVIGGYDGKARVTAVDVSHKSFPNPS